ASSVGTIAVNKGIQGDAYGKNEFTRDAIIEALTLPLRAALVNVSFFGQVPEGAGPLMEMLIKLNEQLPGPVWAQELLGMAVKFGAGKLPPILLGQALKLVDKYKNPENFADLLAEAKRKADELEARRLRGS